MYDRLAPRRFEFVPLWGLRVFFLYAMRRVDCPRCGVTVERVPWADGKHQLTTTYMWFLARWAKRLSWQEVARVFHSSWDQVFRSVAMAVAWGRDHVDLAGIRAIGIDEIHWQRGSHFLTLVYQIDPTRKRLLWIGQHRRAKTVLQFFRWFGKDRTAALTFICSDMWKPYLKVVAKKAGQAVHILDRFHIAKHMSDAIDQVRRAEAVQVTERAARQAHENLELAEGRYQTGVGNVIGLVDAQTARAGADADRVRALYDHETAIAALERAIGQETPTP